jgi:AcrR family transcriptional regulator
MARPREFDEREVLDRALEAFWARGYEGTSIGDLTRATGLVRASLYGAFGDKQKLYERALAHYVARLGEMLPAPASGGSARANIRAMFESYLRLTCPSRGPHGCFLMIAAGDGPAESDLAARLSRQSRAAFVKLLRAELRRGAESGELSSSVDPARLAPVLMLLLHGIAAAARAGRPRAELDETVSAALDALLPAGRSSPSAR